MDKVYLDIVWQFATLNLLFLLYILCSRVLHMSQEMILFPLWQTNFVCSCLVPWLWVSLGFSILRVNNWQDWFINSPSCLVKMADIQLSWPHTWSIMILSFLQVTARALPYLEEDERLLPKLTNLRFVLLAQYNAITLSGEFCCLVYDDLLVFRYNVFNI